MGMFDEVRCSAPIGELTDVLTQTKDISDDYFEGGTMSFYWIDPSGQMWGQIIQEHMTLYLMVIDILRQELRIGVNSTH